MVHIIFLNKFQSYLLKKSELELCESELCNYYIFPNVPYASQVN